MAKENITIFTPTYNRAYKLNALYESLITQTNQNFEWLIIDDGSTDNTKKTIQTFIDENKLKIRYLYKSNEGKHIAINEAAKVARGKWFFIVDSDDYLTCDALEVISKYCKSIECDEKFAGVVGLRGNEDGNAWTTGNLQEINSRLERGHKLLVDKEYLDATSLEYRYKFRIQGDRAEVIRTDILKKYPFPKFDDETFMAENYLWFSLSRDGYKFRWFNSVIYITEYLEDGLTRNGKLLAKNNCRSRSYLDNFMLELEGIPFREKCKCAINYYRYGKLSGKTWISLFKECNDSFLSVIALPIAVFTRL